jgi:hypothetical protein
MKLALLTILGAAAAACGDASLTPTAEPPAPYSVNSQPLADVPRPNEAPGPIPPEFRHAWALQTADCSEKPGLTRIVIGADSIAFYEGRSAVISATVPHEDALTLEVDHAAEGAVARETHALALDDTGRKLTYERRGVEYVYTRCD